MKLRSLLVGLIVGATLLLVARGAAAASSEQIVFSAQNPPSVGSFTPTGGTATPFGFWIWCEASGSPGKYSGKCSGAMYFYALGLIKGVGGTVKEVQEGQYTMTVGSSDGKVACMLTNEPSVTSGNTNTIDVTCTAPGGTGHATNAVVQVTGG